MINKGERGFPKSITQEMRSSLAAILGFGNLLKNTPLDKQQKEYLESIITEGKSLLDLADNIAQISFLEQNQHLQEYIDFDIEFLVNDVFRTVDKKYPYQPVSKYVDIIKNFSYFLKGDPIKLRRVLGNLLDNAIKRSVKGEVCVIVTEVTAEEEIEGVILRFTVKDTSGGVSKQKQSEIDMILNQKDEVLKYNSEGMGLSVSQSLVKAMQGKIWMESTEGEGCTFSFTVRFQKGSEIVAKRKLAGVKAVILDDHQGSRAVARRYCEEQGVEVLGAVGSLEDIFKIVDRLIAEKNPPEVILSDVVLAGVEGWMYGYELVQKIKESEGWKNIKIIAMTSDIRYGSMSGAAEEGFDGYLVKPFTRKELLNVFEEVLDLQTNKGKRDFKKCKESYEDIKILVVEDAIVNQRLIQACFSILGCEGDYVINGEEAIKKLEVNTYDMCLMDLMMPVMNGIEAAKIIREKISKDFPIIALTSAITEFSREACLKAGMNDYMTKPLDILKLEEKIIQYALSYHDIKLKENNI